MRNINQPKSASKHGFFDWVEILVEIVTPLKLINFQGQKRQRVGRDEHTTGGFGSQQ